MNRMHILLALTFVAIAMAGQWTLSYHSERVQQVTASDNGPVFGIIQTSNEEVEELRVWPKDLSVQTTLHRSRDRIEGLATNRDGTTIAFLTKGDLIAFDVKERRDLWRIDDLNRRGQGSERIIRFIDDGNRIAVLERVRGTQSTALTILSAGNGSLVGKTFDANGIRAFYWHEDQLLYLDNDQRLFSIQINEGGTLTRNAIARSPQELANWRGTPVYLFASQQDLPAELRRGTIPDVRTERNYFKPVSIQRVDPQTRDVVNQFELSPAPLKIDALRLAIGLATMFWVALLVRDGRKSEKDSRLPWDLICVVALLHFFCVDFAQAPIDQLDLAQLSALLALDGAVIICILFCAPLIPNRTTYVWGVSLLTCAAPPLAPLTASSLLLWRYGWRLRRSGRKSNEQESSHRGPPPLHNSQSDSGSDADDVDAVLPVEKDRAFRFRFGIRQMLMMTAGAALFIAVGWQSLAAFWMGFSLCFAVAIGLAFSIRVPLSLIGCLGGTLAVTLTSHPAWTFLSMFPFVFGTIKLYGWDFRRSPAD